MPKAGQYAEWAQNEIEDRCCPCCGQELPPKGKLGITLGTTWVEYRGKRLTLSHYQVLIVEALLKQAPNVVPKERLFQLLYGGKGDDIPGSRVLDVHIHKIRDRLAGLGPQIVTAWGRGYALEVPDDKLSDNEGLNIQQKEMAHG